MTFNATNRAGAATLILATVGAITTSADAQVLAQRHRFTVRNPGGQTDTACRAPLAAYFQRGATHRSTLPGRRCSAYRGIYLWRLTCS